MTRRPIFPLDRKYGMHKRISLAKTKKLAPKYCGTAIIIHVNESIAKLKTEKNKLKTINVNKLKHFFPGDKSNLDATDNANAHEDQPTPCLQKKFGIS